MKDESYKPKKVETRKDENYKQKKVANSTNKSYKLTKVATSTNDKTIQEILASILTSIYILNQNTRHTALKAIAKCEGITWVIIGEIKNFPTSIDQQKLIKIIREKIQDEKFINLIWKFIKAGYLENNNEIIGPILVNIYLNELDKYMSSQQHTYIRVEDKFIIGIKGSKKEAEATKEETKKYLKEQLELELINPKVSNTKEKVRFLEYDLVRAKSGRIRLLMPQEIWMNKLKECKAMKVVMKDGKEQWIPCHRTSLVNKEDIEIFKIYNAEIRRLYNYYKLAENVSSLNSYYHIMKFSFTKTMGNKYKISVRKVFRKYNIEGQLGIRYGTNEKICYFYNEGFKTKQDWKK